MLFTVRCSLLIISYLRHVLHGRFLIAGYSYDPDCMYVNGTGRDYYEFYIQLNRCGTLGENTHHQDSRKNPTVRKADDRASAVK